MGNVCKECGEHCWGPEKHECNPNALRILKQFHDYIQRSEGDLLFVKSKLATAQAEIARLRERLEYAKIKLRDCLKAEQEQWDEAAVLKLTDEIKAFLPTPTDPDEWVTVRREDLDMEMHEWDADRVKEWTDARLRLEAALKEKEK